METLLLNIANSKLFNGCIMLLMNIGGKYLAIDLPNNMEKLFSTYFILRCLVLFSIFFMATRDIKISIMLSLLFFILTFYLFMNIVKDMDQFDKKNIDEKNIGEKNIDEKLKTIKNYLEEMENENALEKIKQVIMDKINKKLDLNPPMIFDKRFSLTAEQKEKLGSEWDITNPSNEKASHWIKDYCIMRDSLKILTEDEKSSPDSKLKKFSQKIIENKAQLVQKREPGVLGWLKSLMAGKYGLKELGNHFVTSANKMGLGLERKKPVAEEKSSSPKPGRS